ncbi:MAG: hypothetical protein KatS3mg008_0201 [Acidimicrobiales bacterium]|nr:MAG: hypothetical protein KatS3mg008_0201 [Acidimicrobiales bacterium]
MHVVDQIARACFAALVLAASCTGGRADDGTSPTVVAAAPVAGPAGRVEETRELPRFRTDQGVFRQLRVVYVTRAEGFGLQRATGLLLLPPGQSDALVVWGHPTRGLADECAPSLEGAEAVPFAVSMLARGWTVFAPDFPGLGTDAPHPYLVSSAEGASVLDGAAAARSVAGESLSAAAPTVLWGFSQGGHAVLAAAELASRGSGRIAHLAGVLAAAPVADPLAFARWAMDTPGQLGVLVAILKGVSTQLAGAHPDSVFRTSLGVRTSMAEHLCMGELVAKFSSLDRSALRSDPTRVSPWREGLLVNRIDGPIDVPVVILQGTEDPIVSPRIAEKLFARLCRASGSVRLEKLPGRHDAAGEATVITALSELMVRENPSRSAGRTHSSEVAKCEG